MRRTQWAVFTSMNPRPSAWRALYEPAVPAEPAAAAREKQDDAPGAAAVEPAEERTVAGYE